ncbi:MAG: ATP-binding protein [Planctomycetia bacterium]|nr:ATP-binding protein [Planctomycetia bacterium]
MITSKNILNELFHLSDGDLADLSTRVKHEAHRRTLAATEHVGSEIIGLEMAKRVVTVAVGGGHSVVFVGREGSGKTMLRALAAQLGLTETFEARPCLCGNHGDPHRRCRCTERQLVSHQRHWPRAEIFCEVVAPSEREFRANLRGTSLDEIRAVIDRKGAVPGSFDAAADSLLSYAIREFGLRLPVVDTIRRVARTVAALDRSDVVTSSHLNEAINYRMPD